jgi:ATP-dependent RNA helicase DeaD
MGDGSVWFSASIGSRKNAEARWLLPMICRRGGIDKSDIGAIRIMDTTTEFEISARAAESFAVKIRRPDKEDNIRIDALAGPSPREEVREKEWIGASRRTRESRGIKMERLQSPSSERRKRRSFAADRRELHLVPPPI